jgi:hypothetical protein
VQVLLLQILDHHRTCCSTVWNMPVYCCYSLISTDILQAISSSAGSMQTPRAAAQDFERKMHAVQAC